MPPLSEAVVRNRRSKIDDGQVFLKEKEYKWDIIWVNVVAILIMYISAVYGMYLLFFNYLKWQSVIFTLLYTLYTATGVTAGSHRLWSHRCYQGNLFVKIFMAIGHSSVFPDSIYRWVRDHRLHHKFTDTDADPHNSRRGLFYSHVGWLMLKKNKLVVEKGRTINLDDIVKDPVVMFQNRHKYVLFVFFALVFPTFVPWYFWNEDAVINFWVQVFRFMLTANLIMTLNSFAHKHGSKPYDKSMNATDEQPLRVRIIGEVYHNYHHVFPWDYRAAEYPYTGIGTTLIYLWSKIGWTWDLRTASNELIRKRMLRTGDGTVTPAMLSSKAKIDSPENLLNGENGVEKNVWGWGDPDMNESDMEEVIRNGGY